ncbi:type I restriction endonuclease subunit R, EcoR124 family [Helcococcus kunzii]
MVIDRLLTGFDAPILSTLFINRSPMAPHNLIQAFSAIKVYSEYYEMQAIEIMGVITDEEFENYLENYHNIIDELKRTNADDGDDDIAPIDVEY